MTDQPHGPEWTFLSNHSHVLYCISVSPGIRIREIAAMVQITERAVQRIVVDLERGGYLKRQRVGRQNQYRLKPSLHLRHPLEQHVQVGRLLTVLQPAPKPQKTRKVRTAVAARRRAALPARPATKSDSPLIKSRRGPGRLLAQKYV